MEDWRLFDVRERAERRGSRDLASSHDLGECLVSPRCVIVASERVASSVFHGSTLSFLYERRDLHASRATTPTFHSKKRLLFTAPFNHLHSFQTHH